MKTILRIAVSMLLTYALLNLAGCNASTTNNNGRETTAEVSEEFEEERTEVTEDLRELRDEINEEMARVKQQMGKAAEGVRQQLSVLNNDLQEKRNEVDTALQRVERATKENWSDVSKGARNTFREVKREFNELSDRITG